MIPGIENIDWQSMWELDVSPLEIFVRGTVMYIGLFVLIRVILKRETGNIGITDLLMIVLIADAAQNAMAGEYQSITAGILLVLTILGWTLTLDMLAFYCPRLRPLIHPPPLCLIRDGKLQYHNMRKELVTRAEVMEKLREEGIDTLEKVKKAYIEGDGNISVIPYEDK